MTRFLEVCKRIQPRSQHKILREMHDYVEPRSQHKILRDMHDDRATFSTQDS